MQHKFPETEGPVLNFEKDSFKIELKKEYFDNKDILSSPLEGGEEAVQESQGDAEFPFLAADYYKSLPRVILVEIFIDPDEYYEVNGVTFGGAIENVRVKGGLLMPHNEDKVIEEAIQRIANLGAVIERPPEGSREKKRPSSIDDLIDMQYKIKKMLISKMLISKTIKVVINK